MSDTHTPDTPDAWQPVSGSEFDSDALRFEMWTRAELDAATDNRGRKPLSYQIKPQKEGKKK